MRRFVIIDRRLVLLLLASSLLWAGAAPSHADGASWWASGFKYAGCSSYQSILVIHTSGLDADPYTFHTVVTSGGATYVNADDTTNAVYPDDTWSLVSNFTYGSVANQADYPIPAGHPV